MIWAEWMWPGKIVNFVGRGESGRPLESWWLCHHSPSAGFLKIVNRRDSFRSFYKAQKDHDQDFCILLKEAAGKEKASIHGNLRRMEGKSWFKTPLQLRIHSAVLVDQWQHDFDDDRSLSLIRPNDYPVGRVPEADVNSGGVFAGRDPNW